MKNDFRQACIKLKPAFLVEILFDLIHFLFVLKNVL